MSGLEPGRNCWRIERVDKATVLIDADRYFRAARSAMLKAKQQILLIGWDFDARIDLVPGEHVEDGAPHNVGDFISWLVDRNADLNVYLLRWDVGAVKSLLHGKTIFTVIKWMRHPRIHTKLDSFHPVAASHHQKIVVIDDCLAFCGGIDMTSERWDTREHLDDQPSRMLNGKPYKPWHDATTALQGPVAGALGELCRDRWALAGGDPIDAPDVSTDCWPDGLDVDFNDIEVAISRSQPEMPGVEAAYEIEALYLDLIARATRHIYAESQYFASRVIAEAIASRLDEADGPEVVIVNPVTAEGWLEPVAMDTARARLFEALKHRDTHDRLRMYHPHTAGGAPIYVHAKILIIDDRVLRVGSSNFNNRSMRLDTECDVTIDADRGADPACVRAIRDGLIAEHLGLEIDEVMAAIDQTGSLIEAIERLRGPGKTLLPYEVPDLGEVEKWLADNEVFDPEGPSEMFEVSAKRGLFRRLRFWKRRKG
ncbi:phospholipase [Sphingomonas sp. So64.6b]|uniref:phospholipase D-like domain-containing protein n=1 Tax=Sphingomonas sp. So64.6b TaxID=2997354 RepID=UPI001601C4B1|nr:phospholipase D-like domain-containing protein [Sphingomonas sp. So64.6b]QNA84665.1 phospholipase [Sphingomonas sp. So64.6b]